MRPSLLVAALLVTIATTAHADDVFWLKRDVATDFVGEGYTSTASARAHDAWLTAYGRERKRLEAAVEALGGHVLSASLKQEKLRDDDIKTTDDPNKNLFRRRGSIELLFTAPRAPDAEPLAGAAQVDPGSLATVELAPFADGALSDGWRVDVTLEELGRLWSDPETVRNTALGAHLRRAWQSAVEESKQRGAQPMIYLTFEELSFTDGVPRKANFAVLPKRAAGLLLGRSLTFTETVRTKLGVARPKFTVLPEADADLMNRALREATDQGGDALDRLVAARSRAALTDEDRALIRELVPGSSVGIVNRLRGR